MFKNKADKTGSFSVTDSAGNKSRFTIDEKNVEGIFYNKDKTYKLQTPRPERKYNNILGCQLTGSEYTVFFSNLWHTDLASVSFNFVTNTVEQHLIPLNLDKESYFSSFIYKNKLYFITRLKGASGMRLFTFLHGDHFAKTKFTFDNINLGLTSLYTALDPDNVAKINSNTSYEFDIVARKTKIFVIDGVVNISLDHAPNSTYVVRINLENHESVVSVYDQATTVCQVSSRASSQLMGKNSTSINPSSHNNSFIYKDKLFQFSSCKAGIDLRIRNMADGKIIKQYTTADGEEITFRNSEILQDGTNILKNEKELTSKQFIRRTSKSTTFVSVSEKGETLSVTLGGITYTGYASTSGPGGSVMTPPGIAYETRYYFNSLLSKDSFEHIRK